MNNAPKFKVGDRVINKHSYGQPAGVIVKVNRMTAIVKLDRDVEPKKVHLESFRHETADDVATRTHADAYRAWQRACPKTRFAQVGYSGTYTSNESYVRVSASTSGVMRDAAHELMLLADWWDTRPKEPTK